jgi:hypothetical protein
MIHVCLLPMTPSESTENDEMYKYVLLFPATDVHCKSYRALHCDILLSLDLDCSV